MAMNQHKPVIKWNELNEKFARIRAQIRQVLATSNEPLDIAQIATEFKLRFRYLPEIERRLRELKDSGDVKRNEGKIPTYELVKGEST
jgi:hypothetical protein